MTSRILAFAVISLFIAAPRQAQEAYTLKIKEPVKGETYHVVLEDSDTTTSKAIDGQGQVLLDLTVTKGKSYAYGVNVLDNAPGQIVPTSSIRNYEKAVITEGNKDNRISNPSSLQGKKVLIQKKGNGYEIRLDDGTELTALQLEELDNNPANVLPFELLMPKKAVKLDETWSIDPVQIVNTAPKEIAGTLDAAKASAKGKLTKVYKKDNKLFGVIELNIEFPFKEGSDMNGIKLSGGKVTLKGTLDGCIDGGSLERTFKKTMDIDLQGSQEANGMRISVTVRMSGSSENSSKEAQKK